jgi:hypothetical protein
MLGVQVRLRCSAIVAVAHGEYELTIRVNDEASARTFVFKVDEKDEIQVVTGSEDFEELLNHMRIPVVPLFEAVSAFHQACDLTWTPVES